MKGMILLLISVALVNNVVLSQFLGLCPFLGVSKKLKLQLVWGERDLCNVNSLICHQFAL